MKVLARRNREQHAILAEVEEERDVKCFDDITDRELPWHAVRKAREQELKYPRDFGVYEKVDESEAIARYLITNCCTRSSKVTIGQICVQGLLYWRR